MKRKGWGQECVHRHAVDITLQETSRKICVSCLEEIHTIPHWPLEGSITAWHIILPDCTSAVSFPPVLPFLAFCSLPPINFLFCPRRLQSSEIWDLSPRGRSINYKKWPSKPSSACCIPRTGRTGQHGNITDSAVTDCSNMNSDLLHGRDLLSAFTACFFEMKQWIPWTLTLLQQNCHSYVGDATIAWNNLKIAILILIFAFDVCDMKKKAWESDDNGVAECAQYKIVLFCSPVRTSPESQVFNSSSLCSTRSQACGAMIAVLLCRLPWWAV